MAKKYAFLDNLPKNEILWADKKRWLGLPWTFTKYEVDAERLYLRQGFWKTQVDETLLYRILDIKSSQTLGQRIFGVGSVTLYCTDRSNEQLELNRLVKKYQPDCLINPRIGNGAYDYVSLGDNEVPGTPPPAVIETGNYNALGGYKYSPYGLYETAGTMNRSWGFKYYDNNWKSADEVWRLKKYLNEHGLNYLLNVGPDGLGRFPVPVLNIFNDLYIK